MGSQEMTFEEALTRLEEVVREMENSQLPLDQALELFAEGINLSKYCNHCLAAAEQKISVLLADGSVSEEPATLPGGKGK
ncbi:exodeoxyribonuclease VII small subunit [Desulforamulus ruminis]|uniref:Exodeoxyribonuclease 7 small subunit n=1 Tax=Desulforamulus ruminis (strain ATCC 23193 / DSM 2154 / NCIMB 8452 / DL) TaxID=696281 RepID=F6DU97_DESRL|nr:exodeoxyribonuclease VII small subunit [Desulforamulus ruminis]AEG61282.1 exodeoxyribonuclease VII, small subunit [Desulforamulus ruminis DSM 2154]